jgi:hypothetical protein
MEEIIFTDDYSDDEPLWNRLIDQIVSGNVIPVIGPDVLIDKQGQDGDNIHNFLINGLSKYYNLSKHYKSFTDLIYDMQNTPFINKKEIDKIYLKLAGAIAKMNVEPSKKLTALLATKLFPFVITTSFTPVVEKAMVNIWGEKLKVMKFCDNPPEDNDIVDEEDLRTPTVYYMFGKYSNCAHRYVLTDNDMLNFCSSWLSDVRRPKNLCNELKNKYVLMLGNDYPDWLFRFIWFSIRKDNMSDAMLAYDNVDESLINFLERNEAFTQQNQEEVIDQILLRLQNKMIDNEKTKFNKPKDNMDIFISYSRSDRELAEALYKELTLQGKNVWFDKNNIAAGDNFMDEINKSIYTAKFFVPILSENITKERNMPHIYRKEWKMAIDVESSMGRKYIIPVAPENYDINNAPIPSDLAKLDMVKYNNINDVSKVAIEIINQMNID